MTTKALFEFYKNSFKKHLFHRNFLKLLSFITVIIILMSTVILYSVKSISVIQYKTAASEQSASLAAKTNEIFSQTMDIANFIASTEGVSFYIKNSNNERSEFVIDRIHTQLSQSAILSHYIENIYIYSEQNNSVLTSRNENTSLDIFNDKDFYSYYKKSNEIFSYYPRKMFDNYPYALTFIRKIELKTGEKGAVVLNLNVENLFLTSRDSDTINYIFDANNNILYSGNIDLFMMNATDTEVLSPIINSNKKSDCNLYSRTPYAFSISEINKYNIRCISVTDLSANVLKIIFIQYFAVFICILFLILSVLLAYRFSRNYYKPFEQIRSLVDEPISYDITSIRDEDTLYISRKIIEYMNTNEMLRNQISDYMEQTAKLRVYSMQCQLNPHFLYNTMNNINLSLIKKLGAKDESIDVMKKLSKLMMYTMDISTEIVPFETDLKFTMLYIDILKARIGDAFDFKCDVESELHRAKIPKLCFQPLIENAFLHGLMPSEKDCLSLFVHGKRDNDNIIITIKDNGMGMSREKLDEIRSRLKSNNVDTATSSHIGIDNVNSRIKLIFGNEYGVDIESTDGVGTDITLTLPLIEETDFKES